MSTEILLNYGVLGTVLLWFMVRLEKRLEKLEEAIRDLAEEVKHIP